MEIKEFINKLQQHSFSLTVDGTRLILKADKHKLTEAEVNAVKNNREIIDFIRNNKEKLIEYINEIKKRPDNNISSIYRLSSLQAGMLFHNLYNAETGAYRNQLKCDLHGLKEAAFTQSWQYLLRRHSILRSSFYYDAFKIPVQCVHREVSMPVEIIDYRHLPDERKIEQALAYEEADRQQGFDFKAAPLMRVVLLRLEDDHYRMLWSSHHILMDGWSMPVLIEEFLRAYEAYAAGQEPAEGEEDRYEDYIRYLERRDKEAEESYWKQYLSGLEAGTMLPFIASSSRRTHGVGEFREEVMHFGPTLAASVNDYARKNRITINTLMQGIWSYLLHQYTGSSDVTFGVVMSGRPEDLPGVERRVGMYINTLPLRSVLCEDGAIPQWLQRLQQDQSGSQRHQYSSLSDVQRWAGVQGDLFDSIMVFQNYPVSDMIAAADWSLKVENLVGLEQTSNYPLLLRFSLDRDITLQLIYKDDLIAPVYIRQLKTHFEQVLLQILSQEDLILKNISLLDDTSRRQLLYDFNDTAVSWPAETGKTLVALFEQQVQRTPDKIAAFYEDQQLTYNELNIRANQLAHYLRRAGVGTETLVPLFADRSLEILTGILGILKAGGAYVPVDPSYPEARIRYILNDTKAAVMVTNAGQLSTTGLFDGRVIDLVADKLLIADEPITDLANVTGPDKLAYIIYTSGSTGNPKGVMMEHAGIVNFLLNQRAAFGINETDRILQFTGYSFDASVEQIFSALTTGATLIVAPDYVRLDRELFDQFMHTNKITHLHATPVFLRTLSPERYKELRRVIAAGDVCKRELAERWAPFCKFYNKYGPTEAAVSVAQYQYNSASVITGINTVPIGQPLANTQIYILDRNGVPVPLGITGELCIGGVQVARGYLNNETLTAQKFISDPFRADNRLYKTGDLARWLPGGIIEYIGRTDDQVKIRGYRIELGEIEHVLQQYPGVHQCVAIVSGDNNDNKRLIAYVNTSDDFNQEEAMKYLKSRLVEYMVPSLVVRLEAIPLTINGKVDRKKLAALDNSSLLAIRYQAPRNEMEQGLATIWQELLSVEKVGINDNFFELGGDSIITIQVVSRARRLGYELQVGDLFNYHTIARISAALQERSGVVKEEGQSAEGECGLLPVQQDYLQRTKEDVSHYNQSVLLSISKEISAAVLNEVTGHILSHHDSLRFRYYQDDNGQWHQSYTNQQTEVFIADLSSLVSEDLGTAIKERCDYYHRQLDIEQGILVRVVLMQTADAETYNRLFITIHHLAVDGVSWRILLEDMEMLLSAIQDGSRLKLSRKTASYRQWYEQLVQYGQRKSLQRQLAYWKQLQDAYEPLPVDAADRETASSESHVSRLGKQWTNQLLQEVSQVYHTEINDMLLAGLTKVLCEWSSRSSLVIGLEGHGRIGLPGDIDLSRTIGWFTAKYPVRLPYETAAGTDQLIKGVKEALRQTPDKGLGYGVIRYLVKEEALQGDSWDVLFNYLGRADNVLSGSQWFHPASENTGQGSAEKHMAAEGISINAVVADGELVIRWDYNTRYYNAATISELSAAYVKGLEDLITHCLKRKEQGVVVFTPADYGLSGEVGYDELDVFLHEPLSDGQTRQSQIESCYRLSPLQSGMLFHNLYDGEAEAYRNQLKCDLYGLQEEAFTKSWRYLLKQHSILRSSFHHDSLKIPVQCVYREVDIPIEILDYREMTSRQQEDLIKAREEADRQQGFDFSSVPLMRIVLIRLTEDRYRMLWSSHHILMDGWSIPVLIEQFLRAYDAYATGQEPESSPQDQYEDYIRYLERRDKDAEETYWQAYLEELEGGTTLPFITTNVKGAHGAGQYKEETLSLDAEEATQIVAFAKSRRLTVNTLMQGVWSYLLHQYTGSSDIVYGVVMSGRPEDLPGVETRVGMYINTLPLRSRLKEDQPVGDWLQNLQQDQLQSRIYQYASLTDLQKWSGVQGDLFDNIMVFQNYPVSEVLTAADWQLKVDDLVMLEQANYPFYISVGVAGKINVNFFYNVALFEAAYVEQIKTHFRHVLLQFIREDNPLLGDIRLLNDAARSNMINMFSNAAGISPATTYKTVVELFEAQATLTPDHTAAIYGDQELTFAALNAQANQLAHYLIEKGVGVGTLVPVYAERSLEQLIAIIGIMKAGGAYVPLDPAHPEQRIAYLLDDTAAKIVITGPADKKLVPENASALTLVDLVADEECLSAGSAANPEIAIADTDLAYIIYTSGSTGRPKGVMIEHRSLSNYLLNSLKRYTGAGMGSFAHLSYTFDASLTAMFVPLLNGRSVILSDVQPLEVFKSAAFTTGNFDFVKMTPAHLQLLEDVMSSTVMNMPGKIVLGGEQLNYDQIQYLENADEEITIINEYGPTEATVGCCVYHLSNRDLTGVYGAVPIGQPLDNVNLYIVDRNNEPVALGVAGELLIGGVQVARGYLNNPALTAEKFIASPFIPGDRLYRTGDLARLLPDGNIEFVGRIDEQLKINGYRIEPAEIEAALRNIRGVREAIVLPGSAEKGQGAGMRAYAQVDRQHLPLLANYQGLLHNKVVTATDLHVLPNGLPVLSANINEVRFLYKEIFQDQCYIKQGLYLRDNSCVIDIGANVGFSTLFLHLLHKDITIYSFEPIPEVYHYLAQNRALYNVKGKSYQCAISDSNMSIELTYYPEVSIVSGINESSAEAKELVRAYVEHAGIGDLSDTEIDAMLDAKLTHKRITCQARTVSQVIREEQLTMVDLLKIDVENSEEFVLAGIEEEDWNKINSVIIEVHDVEGRLDRITGLLERQGFRLYTEKEPSLSGDNILYNIFAFRHEITPNIPAYTEPDMQIAEQWQHPDDFIGTIKSALQQHLPAYMIPAHVVLLDKIPLTHNGKTDRKALLSLPVNVGRQEQTRAYTETELQLIAIWKELLELKEVGVNDDFFHIGGDSLLAIRMISAIRKQLGVEVSISAFFELLTIEEVARYIKMNRQDEVTTAEDYETIQL
ncbi:non-ribosomal peptide synthetase [Chitinophaga rhizophila]|uniref:Amino acid adenylation domain-containing protein n=1 Tax=Chitinophaga rhizophila TaxID=2866212 RepID=A0ABS7G783_9BACT|nr:non-ribosomal peptide synthetase [Chitinophaga rhizophila]MBW8683316.1 amino acid adenylation domain-containing protein [Chitinophaga rhizophila]